MEFWDLLFREYASPFTLLNPIIRVGRFTDFLTTFWKKREEQMRWEFYLHKLGPLDDRTWDQFNSDLDFGTAQEERPSDKDIEETVRTSYKMMKDFKPDDWKGV